MDKKKKVICICVLIVVVTAIQIVLFSLWYNGAFDPVEEIASFDSPSGNYKLYFQKIGGNFGKPNVRLILKDLNEKTINSIETSLLHEGTLSEHNIELIEWSDISVAIVLKGSDMPSKEIELKFQK